MSEPTDVKLNVINHSNDSSHSEFVIFQQNVSESFDLPSIAWIVIKGLDQGEHHPFVFEWKTQIDISDKYGNFSPRLDATPGQKFEVTKSPNGENLEHVGEASKKDLIQVVNYLPNVTIGAHCYRSGKLLSSHNFVEPSKQAEFHFKPSIYIGAVSQMEEGEPISTALADQINTQFDLKDILSADIVITGGGEGRTATSLKFTLENVKKRQ